MAKGKAPKFEPGEGEDKSRGTLYLSDRGYDMVHMLAGLGGGKTMDELATHLDEVVNAVCETGDKGSITLKLQVSPVGRNPESIEHVIIEDALSRKQPRRTYAAQFEVDVENRIRPRSDAQLALDLIRVTSDGEVVDPDAEGAGPPH